MTRVDLPALCGVSVLVLTKNEGRDLPECLRSVAWADDIHVYDSDSTDDTEAVARCFGARWIQREPGARSGAFGGDESEHRNWGLRNIPFKHEWVLQLDADERVTPGLAASVESAIREPGGAVAFRVRRRDYLNGRWLKHAQATPYYIRLFKPASLRYERRINPVPKVAGSISDLPGHLDHFPFSKGVSHWIARHNWYSTLEAEQIVEARSIGGELNLRKSLSPGDFNERRSHQKELFYRLPYRPLVKFLFLYAARGGFLDGAPGFTYAVLQSIYEYFIVLKTRELEAAGRAVKTSPQQHVEQDQAPVDLSSPA